MGFWLSAINVKYRDVRFVVPFFIQLMMFVSPIIYPSSVAGRFKSLLYLNPFAGLVEAHRYLILGQGVIDYRLVAVSVFFAVIIFVTGYYFFRHFEKGFADII
jgi:lipopolysaccharide transport system permease protein